MIPNDYVNKLYRLIFYPSITFVIISILYGLVEWISYIFIGVYWNPLNLTYDREISWIMLTLLLSFISIGGIIDPENFLGKRGK